jgi:hypothetical protein
VAIFGSNRRGPWNMNADDIDGGPDRPFDTPPADLAGTILHEPSGAIGMGLRDAEAAPMGTGLSAAEAALMSSDPSEETLS